MKQCGAIEPLPLGEETGGFFDLEAGDTARSFALDVAPFRTVGNPDSAFLFGGIGLGATIAAVERVTGRATVWATAQYLSFAPKGARVLIDVLPLVEGRYTTQARAVVRDGAREVLGAGLSLGGRPAAPRRQWSGRPHVPGPADCPRMPIRWGAAPDDMYSKLDVRVAKGWDALPGEPESGHIVFWLRPLNGAPVDRPMLALMGDFVPASIGNALGEGAGDIAVNSLDNCIRYLTLAETDWVLADIQVHGAADGFAHGRMLLFASDGTLMASASQSVIVRSQRHPRGD